MADQAPLLILLFPLFGAVIVSLVGPWKKQLCLPVVIIAMTGSLAAALTAFCNVLQYGQVQYFLGGWDSPRGIGIELRIDHVNGLVAIVVATVALITALYSARRVDDEFEGKVPLFYALYLLSTTGLAGMTLAGDAFLDILEYACGLKLDSALILNQNPFFEMASIYNKSRFASTSSSWRSWKA